MASQDHRDQSQLPERPDGPSNGHDPLLDVRSNGALGPRGHSSNGTGRGQLLGRRRHHRVNWGHHDMDDVMLEVEEPGEDWRPIACTLVDLGSGGVGVLAAEPLDPDSLVRITFPLPNRLGRDAYDTEDDALAFDSWSSLGRVVHARHTPEPVHQHVPPDVHQPHHHGLSFQELEGEAEMRLMSALYGPMPEGWAVERYTTRPSGRERYAVVRDGKRLALGFGSYDRARARAWSLHMDEVALAARRRKGA